MTDKKKKSLVGLPRNFRKPPAKGTPPVRPAGTKNGHEIGPNDCRYIFGEPGLPEHTVFCGKPCRKGSAYCEDHHRACYDGTPPKPKSSFKDG